MPLRVSLQKTTRFVERDVMLNRRKHVQDFTLILRGVADAVGCKDRQPKTFGNADRSLVADLFDPAAVTLQLDIDIAGAEEFGKLLDTRASLRLTASSQRGGKRAFVSSRKAKKTGGELRNVRNPCAALGFVRLAHFEAGDELAQVLVSNARRAKKRQTNGLRPMLVR